MLELLLLAGAAFASPAPEGMKTFNALCPAPKRCEALVDAAKACRAKKTDEACAGFLASMQELSAEYDCQRSFDEGFIVPALWLCEEAPRQDALALLASLKGPKARAFYASSDFRRTLDGESAAQHFMKSLELEKKLKKK